MPSSSIATCAATVCTPWPISVQPWRTSTVPSVAKRTTALVISLKPLPRPEFLSPRPTPTGLAGRGGRVVRGLHRVEAALGAALPSSMIWPGPHSAPGVMTLRLADLPAADADSVGEPVEQALHRELGLVGAEAAERAAHRVVGARRERLDVDRRQVVRPAGVTGGALEHLHADRRVRPGVADHARPQR